jgi:hypothetical protein
MMTPQARTSKNEAELVHQRTLSVTFIATIQDNQLAEKET